MLGCLPFNQQVFIKIKRIVCSTSTVAVTKVFDSAIIFLKKSKNKKFGETILKLLAIWTKIAITWAVLFTNVLELVRPNLNHQ